MTKTQFVLTTVLVVHTSAAHAQQSPAPAPGIDPGQGMPPPYAPPPGYLPPPGTATPPAPPPQQPPPGYGPPPSSYGPPPPAYYSAPPPRTYSYPPYYQTEEAPPPARNVLDRPFTLGGGIGFGGLSFKDGLSDNQRSGWGFGFTARLGFGLRPGLILMWDLEGTIVDNGNEAVSQTANLAALQLFVSQRLFLKGGFGLAQVVDSGSNYRSKWGGAAMAGIGYELVQGWNWSLDIEATITGARYESTGIDETWTNWSLVNFALNFF